MTIRRFSSRNQRLDESFLLRHLQGARSYRRIAGYFTSSLFEVAGELLHAIPEVQIVCNVDIHPDDLKVAQLRQSTMLGRWHERAVETEALLRQERYRLLDTFLQRHSAAIRVAPDAVCGFVHGKAGVITLADGRRLGFIGSMNESRSAWQHHYEILWEDDSPEGIAWIEAEFEHLWRAGKPLPEAVVREVHRCCMRREVALEQIEQADDIAPAALVESPMYREGQQLQPWQQGFLVEVLRHQRLHGTVRLLLADEVGLGKTLSLATATILLCLLMDQASTRRLPVLILTPATLAEQWQTELVDKLGITTARWHSQRKVWLSPEGHAISAVGGQYAARCPLRLGIVSTGLMSRDSQERQALLQQRFGIVVLDEAHKARSRQGLGPQAGTPNALLDCMRQLAERAEHVLLGTATPIQTDPADLWDLLGILTQGAGRFVLGNDYAPWRRPEEVLPLLTGQRQELDAEGAWRLLRCPLPQVASTDEGHARRLFAAVRSDLGLAERDWNCTAPLAELAAETRELLAEELERRIDGATFFQRENPIVRHVVLRKRADLETKGLLQRIGVELHPDRGLSKDERTFDALFEGKALRTGSSFLAAYELAQAFGKAYTKRRGRGSGFMKSLVTQRLCSSMQAGLSTAQRLLAGEALSDEGGESDELLQLEGGASSEERAILEELIATLQGIRDDPKLAAVHHFLEVEGWLEQGVIIFSQYYDTALWLAERLAQRHGAEPVGLYAGAERSRLYQHGTSVATVRETLKRAVAEHDIRLMVATDAACEGLNLQTLGTLINVDLPWNPTRLEQRLGRIKRFGQRRENVDMLNLVFAQTVDEQIYERLSERMRNRYDLFGALPDTIEDEWIENIETLGEKMDEYIEAQRRATGFDVHYTASAIPQDRDWRDCAVVLSRRDLTTLLSMAWGTSGQYVLS